MSYRAGANDLNGRIGDIERRLRAVEQPGCCPPDPGWVLAEVDGNLRWIYALTGALGPIIGVQSGELDYGDNTTVINEITQIVGAGSTPIGPAGGVLSGTYPDPGFAVNMATQAELDAHITDSSGAHAASAVSVTPAGGIASTNTQAALVEIDGDLTAHVTDATDAHDGSAISIVPVGTIAATDAQAAVAELDGDIQGHITDAVDAHDGSAISIAPVGTIAATDAQAAVAELDGDIQGHITDVTDAHDASAVSVVPVGTITSTDVQAALAELDGDITGHTHDVKRTLTAVIDGGGIAITTGAKGVYLTVPCNGVITSWRIIADVSGSIVLDLWGDDFASFPPTVADTFVAAAKPTLTAQQAAESSTLTGWTTALTAGDVIEVNVDSASTVTKAVLTLFFTETV